jgi:hypothetical protein
MIENIGHYWLHGQTYHLPQGSRSITIIHCKNHVTHFQFPMLMINYTKFRVEFIIKGYGDVMDIIFLEII